MEVDSVDFHRFACIRTQDLRDDVASLLEVKRLYADEIVNKAAVDRI